jgi:hypothetical protein
MALTKITSKMTDDTIPQKTAHGSMKLPVGTTGQRPTGEAGDLRYNSTTGEFEGYTTEWGSIGGGIGDEYISATPTLSSPAIGTIVIGNYSSYVSPVFITKIGSTVIPHTNNAGTLNFSASSGLSGTQTVSVEASDVGKLYSATATVSVVMPSLTARYWRLTNQVQGGTTTQKPIYKAWHLYPSLNGGGTKRGSASAITASYNYASYNVQNLYPGNTSIAWYLANHTVYNTLASNWVQYDLGSAQEVLSMKWANYSTTTGYYASSFTIQNSNDGTNWADIKNVTQTSGGSTLRTINL